MVPFENNNNSESMLIYRRSITTNSEIGATLYLPSSANGVIRHGYLLLPPDSIANDDAPATLTLNQTWQPGHPGVYLFFSNLPVSDKDKKGFVTAAAQHLKHSDRKNVRFAWFANPEQWSTGLSAPQELEEVLSDNKTLTPQLYAFSTGNYSLRITKNNLISPNTNSNGFIFKSSRIHNSFGSIERARIPDPMELVLEQGHHQGCFRFSLNMSGRELKALDISLYYFWNDQRWGLKRLGYPLFEMPTEDKTWSFWGVFDPLNPFNERTPQSHIPESFSDLCTGLVFSRFDNAGNISSLPTYFRTSFGKQIELIPATTTNNKNNTDGLKQAILTFNNLDIDKKKLSMMLQGDFHLRVALPSSIQSQNNPQHFLCGLSGTETISFKGASNEYPGDIIRFHPLKPAFSSVFPVINNINQTTGSSAILLSDKLTTSWVSIRSNDQTTQGFKNLYYSQPQDAPLFKGTTSSGNRLDVFDAPSANLEYSDIELDCFPLVPIAAAPVMKKIEKETRLQYEFQILNPARKQAIEYYTTKNRPLSPQSRGLEVNSTNIELTTTPQGFLVGFDKTDASRKWQSLILANDQSSTLPPLELKEPVHYVQSAFQTNEQFLVISNPDTETLDYLKHKFQNQINIAGWPFILDVVGNITKSNRSTPYRNILIFKFCKHSLADRLKNPERWTQPDTFNKKSQLNSLAGWIVNYIDRSRSKITEMSEVTQTIQNQHDLSIIRQGYEDFLQKVDDPNWNGIMALQVTLDLTQLPEAIKSIVAGIDIRRFAAHHVGINSNQILSNNGQLDKNFKSSMFGLISYFDQDYKNNQTNPAQISDYLPPVTGDYEFKVLELQVLFRNSEISDFNCKIQLSMNTLFNEPVIKESNKDTSAINKFSVVLEGLYEKHDGHTSYTFRQLSDNSLSLRSTALRSVTVNGITLSTVNETATENEAGKKTAQTNDRKITTRFALTGHIAMQELEDFDMLSYERINFSSLYIDMEFDINAPQGSKRFNFNPADIAIDPTESLLRDDSLVAHFPITLQSLEHYSPSTSANTTAPEVSPTSLGYQQVEAPMNYNAITSNWYSLQFNLNLGTMGSLAAKAGFEATVLLTWSPGIKNKAAQIWIKTPFSGGGGKQFSIQGVLKLVTQSIRLEKQPDKPEYAMLFTNIKVSLLGLKLPPSGNTLLYLFGDPDKTRTGDASGTGNLGWFGAYKQKKTAEEKKSRARNALPDETRVIDISQQPDQ